MEEKNFKQLTRILNADIDGNKSLATALIKVKGINFMLSNALCNHLNIDKKIKVGFMSDEQIKKIEDLIKNPKDLPSWLLNRRKDYDTGENKHITGADLKFTKEFDIKRLKKIKCYRGMRHAFNLPVRGQRTKAHFRKGSKVGVVKKALNKEPSKKKGSGK